MTTQDAFDTLADARQACDGTETWDWGAVATWSGWADYAYRHATVTLDDDGFPVDSDGLPCSRREAWNHDTCLRAYLVSVGASPADFTL